METNNSQNRSVDQHNVDPALAKTMVKSYQASFTDPTRIRVLTFKADEVRNYLSDTTIENFAVFLAQTPEWATDHFGVPNDAKTTVVLVGTDAAGHAVRNASNSFLDYANPCPNVCTLYDTPTFWD